MNKLEQCVQTGKNVLATGILVIAHALPAEAALPRPVLGCEIAPSGSRLTVTCKPPEAPGVAVFGNNKLKDKPGDVGECRLVLKNTKSVKFSCEKDKAGAGKGTEKEKQACDGWVDIHVHDGNAGHFARHTLGCPGAESARRVNGLLSTTCGEAVTAAKRSGSGKDREIVTNCIVASKTLVRAEGSRGICSPWQANIGPRSSQVGVEVWTVGNACLAVPSK